MTDHADDASTPDGGLGTDSPPARDPLRAPAQPGRDRGRTAGPGTGPQGAAARRPPAGRGEPRSELRSAPRSDRASDAAESDASLTRPQRRGGAAAREPRAPATPPGAAGDAPDGAAGAPGTATGRSGPAPRPWVPPVAALLTAIIGLIDLGSVLTPSIRSRIRALRDLGVPVGYLHAAAAGTAATGLLLLLLAKALRRRKRRAWRAVVVLLAADVLLHVLKGLDIEESALALVLLLVLLVYRAEFSASADPRTRWRALTTGLLLAALSGALGFVLLWTNQGRMVGDHSLALLARQVLVGLVGVTGPLHFRGTRFADFSGDVLLGLGFVTVATPLYLLLRPAEPVARLGADDETRMRALLDRHGARDSLGYFALRRDKSVLWSPTGKAAIAYRVVSGVMLASGDPLGDPEAWPQAIARFLEVAAEHAWTPAVMGCSEQAGTVWARSGLSALELGDEAVVDVAEFSLDGRPMRNVRQAVARVERAGYTAQTRRVSTISAAEQATLRAQAAAWRGAETERGFSMALGRFGDAADPDTVVVTATRADGRLAAFLHFVPWGPDGLSLDLMRRDRDADNGLNELLIVAALRDAAGLGVRRVSLNFAVFRSALERGERLGAGPVLRAWRGLLIFVSRWFQIESLYRFNAKFRPEWVPRYVCFPTARDLPRIAIAALEAEAFLVWPRPRLRLVGRLLGLPVGS